MNVNELLTEEGLRMLVGIVVGSAFITLVVDLLIYACLSCLAHVRRLRRTGKGPATLLCAAVIVVLSAYAGSKRDTGYEERYERAAERTRIRRKIALVPLAEDTAVLEFRALTAADYQDGFVLSRIGRSEAWNFSPLAYAHPADAWLFSGAANDWFRLPLGEEGHFPFGTNEWSAVTVFSDGKLRPRAKDPSTQLVPLSAPLDVLAAHQWELLDATNQPSQFWSTATPSNSFLMTWQNVVLKEFDPFPVSFQAELFGTGDFVFRYDLSALPVGALTNVTVGALNAGSGRSFTSIPVGVTSLYFSRLDPTCADDPDPDGDGLTTDDELFVHHTDPYNADTDCDGLTDGTEVALGSDPTSRDMDRDGLVDGSDPDPTEATSLADADGDGLPDAYEEYWYGGTNVAQSATLRDEAGFTLGFKLRAGLCPTNAAPEFTVASGAKHFAAIKLCEAFAADTTSGEVVFERTIELGRTNAWQQYFISSSPSAAGAWCLEGMDLSWDGDAAAKSPSGDSLQLDLDDNADGVTLRLTATSSFVRTPTPLYLIAWAPWPSFEKAQTIVSDDLTTVILESPDGWNRYSIDESSRPSNASRDGEPDFPFPEGASGSQTFPEIIPGAGPALRVCSMSPHLTYGKGHVGGVSHGEYPLNTTCLWRSYRVDTNGYFVCTCEPTFLTGGGFSDFEVESGHDGESAWATVSYAGVLIWSNSVPHVIHGGTTEYRTLSSGSDCDECSLGCEDGNCDAVEGPELGSLAFRIPLGQPREGQTSGFVWFRLDEPQAVTRRTFELLPRRDAAVTATTNNGLARVVCNDSRGRTLVLDDMADGVRIIVTQTSDGTLEHTWEVTNESSSSIHLRKISRRDNVMLDETYAQDVDGTWTRTDNVAGVCEELSEETGESGERVESRLLRDLAGSVLSHTVTVNATIGSGDYAVEREMERRERDADGNWRYAYASYWKDQTNPLRHGKLRLEYGDDRAWRYQSVDGNGRVTLELEQLDGSWMPSGWWDDAAEYALPSLPADTTALATTYDYSPLAGDDGAFNDAESVRTETRYVVRNGTPTMIGRTWTRYTHGTANSHATVTVTTIRAGSATADVNEAGNAVTTVTSYDSDAPGIPLCLRGKTVSETDSDGKTWTFTHAIEGDVLTTVKRAFFNGVEALARRETRSDATHGTLLYEADVLTAAGTPFNTRTHLYDDKNRLRSTTYDDGSFETNAYSCCRLLWSMGRNGVKTMRSAQTGSDHLYYAIEEVSLANLQHTDAYASHEDLTNPEDASAYRVTQHFCDALGRETNTVVRLANAEGAAVDADFVYDKGWRTSEMTEYPGGTSDYSIATDARGVRTVTREYSSTEHEEMTVSIYHPTNLTDAVETTTTLLYRNGDAVTTRAWGATWTRETTRTDYATDGTRIEYRFSEASDVDGVVTNSVTRHDFLGRIVSRETPLSCVTMTYDGSSSRQLTLTDEKNGLVTTIHYDVHGDRIGTTRNDVTTTQENTYEMGVPDTVGLDVPIEPQTLWRVTMQATSTSGETNRITVTKEQITGLSNALRSRSLRFEDGVLVSESESSFDTTSQVLTETIRSAASGESTQKSLHGHVFESFDADGTTDNFFDPFGRVFYTERADFDSIERRSVLYIRYDDFGDLVRTDVFTNANGVVSTSYAHDAFGNRIATTNALGDVETSVYDVRSQLVEASGTTYSVRHAYDTAGRQTRLATTRDGAAWDETSWTYNPTTGLKTAKRYADGSMLAYTYAPDGLPVRKTDARGTWKENAYDANRLLASVSYSSPDTSVYELDYNTFGQCVSVASDDGTTHTFAYDGLSNLTNETIVTSVATNVLFRSIDELKRDTGFAFTRNGAFKASMTYAYAENGRVDQIVLTNAQGRSMTTTYDYLSGYNYGCSLTLPNASVFNRALTRDTYRHSLVTSITNRFNNIDCGHGFVYVHDDLGRPIARNDSTFAYNPRSELISESGNDIASSFVYDEIGNRLTMTNENAAVSYSANALNQYSSYTSNGNQTTCTYDVDGNLTSDGRFTYAYDGENRLAQMTSAALTNGAIRVTTRYDYRSRRIAKIVESYDGASWTTQRTYDFVYDGWNLIYESIANEDGTMSERQYFWGLDLSNTLQGAGGVGGLLAVSIDGAFYLPCYDSNGNIVAYVDENGSTVATYAYDAFGNTRSQSGVMGATFPHRFSTKYHDTESSFYYYGYRFYSPVLGRWINRDPIEEEDGRNLYVTCQNNTIISIDALGKNRYITQFDILNIGGSGGTQIHVGVAVDDWICKDGRWEKRGVYTYDFQPAPSLGNYVMSIWKGKGLITETRGLKLQAPITLKSTPQQDIKMMKMIREEMKSPPFYNGVFHNCIFWSVGAINYGM